MCSNWVLRFKAAHTPLPSVTNNRHLMFNPSQHVKVIWTCWCCNAVLTSFAQHVANITDHVVTVHVMFIFFYYCIVFLTVCISFFSFASSSAGEVQRPAEYRYQLSISTSPISLSGQINRWLIDYHPPTPRRAYHFFLSASRSLRLYVGLLDCSAILMRF